MAVIPLQVAESTWSRSFARQGFTRIHQGKVRDTWKWPQGDSLLLVLATDRVSIFDFVLPVTVPLKGEVLTALTHFWLTHVLKDFPHHLVASVQAPRLNMVHDLKVVTSDLPLERCLVVSTAAIPPFEMIFRHHLGESVWQAYQETGIVAGQNLPPGLKKWGFLEYPLFTPSTKAQEGHDVNITKDAYLEAMGEQGDRAIRMFTDAYSRAYEYARARGILILDTKFEGLGVIADEVLTPDSSRFTTLEDLEVALKGGRDPVFWDKEYVRQWGRKVETPWGEGINNLDPSNPEHLKFVARVEVPQDVIHRTTERYLDIFYKLVGMILGEYQKQEMGIA